MSTKIIFSDNYEIEIDATLSRKHSRSAQSTKHKVSKGSNISDHVISDNKKFSLEGVISEFTQELGGAFLAGSAFDRIEEAIESGELVKIRCKRKNYDNMIITGFDSNDSVQKGNSLVFSVDFEELRFAETKSEKRDLKKFPNKKNNGKTSKDKPNEKQQEKINKKVTKPKSAKNNQISKVMYAR